MEYLAFPCLMWLCSIPIFAQKLQAQKVKTCSRLLEPQKSCCKRQHLLLLPTFLNVDRFNISRGSSLFNMITLILFKKVELKTPLFSIPFIVPVQEARALKYRGDLSSSLVTSLTRTITNMADDKAERTAVYVSFLF